MSIHTRKPWYSRRLHVTIPLVGLFILAGIGFAVWSYIPKAHESTASSIVAGSFPKKVETAPVTEVKDDSTPDVQEVADKVASPEQTSGEPVQLSLSEANDLRVVVNKKHKLPSDYAPSLQSTRGASLRPEAASALESLLSASEAASMATKIVSSYRSYSTQVYVYNGYVNQYGQEYADTISARPGHSEHQTGLAVDVGNANGTCELQTCFGTTAFGEWVKSNAQTFGFIVRYPEGKESLTGYQYEPWHLRYVGTDVAAAVVSSGSTLDQYYGITAGSY